jgi:RimJ/RimL family protein N-acetyltransferase
MGKTLALVSRRQENPAMEPVTLTSERLALRVPGPSDATAVYAACQDPDIQRWVPIPSPYGEQHAKVFVETVIPDGWRRDTVYTFGVFPLSGGPLLGAVNVHVRPFATWEVGYWTVKEHRGLGYATEAVLALARWAFTEHAVARLEWRAEAGNAASRAVAERIGFVFEGTLRGAVTTRGTQRDLWIGGLLPSDIALALPRPYLPAPRG